jgi:hypothetical protein
MSHVYLQRSLHGDFQGPVMPLEITDEMVERAANEIWPLADLSSDEARDELRRDTRRALTVALTSKETH